MERKCSFESRAGSACDNSVVYQLLECNDDISGHLNSCHLSQLVGTLQEHDLILNRAAMYEVSPPQLQSLYICKKHRLSLGKKWRPLKSCQYPQHMGRKSKLTSRNTVNPTTCREIHMIFGTNVAMGSRK